MPTIASRVVNMLDGRILQNGGARRDLSSWTILFEDTGHVAQLSDGRQSGRWPRTGPIRSSTSPVSRSAWPPAYDPALHPLRAELRQMASGRREHLPVPEPGTRIPETGEEPISADGAPTSPRSASKKDFPQVEHAVYVQDNEPVFLKDGQATATEDYLFADDDFLKSSTCRCSAASTPRPRRRPR